MIFHLYGFFVGLGIVAGAWVAEKVRKNCFIVSLFNCSIYELLPWGLIPGIIGARLYHVIDYWQYYSQDPVKILYLWEGGLGIFGGLGGGILGVGIYCLLFHCSIASLFKLLDLIAFGLPIGQAIGRLGNYFNQELYGLPTSLPWGIYIETEKGYFHPLFAYEMVWDIIIFIGLISLIGRIGRVKPGAFFFIYLGLYSFGRFWLEFLRIEPWQIGGINVAQAISLICLISLIWYYFKVWRKKT